MKTDTGEITTAAHQRPCRTCGKTDPELIKRCEFRGVGNTITPLFGLTAADTDDQPVRGVSGIMMPRRSSYTRGRVQRVSA